MEVFIVIVIIVLFWVMFVSIIAPSKPPVVVHREIKKSPSPVLVVDTIKVGSSPLQDLIKPKIEEIKIIPVKQTKLEWFIGDFGIKQISPAEEKIVVELNKYNINWKREVSFRGFVLPTKGFARFDFYLVDHNIIIEYHGKDFHSSPERKEVDRIKKEFCENNKIKLIELYSKHYYNMIETFQLLMEELKVSKV